MPRPARPAPADSRAALLDAAESLFARRGYGATTIKAIGRDAGVNPALLYYYFPDKERLYRAVLERRLGTFARHALTELDPALPPREIVRRLVLGYAGMLRSAPDFPRVIARELADHDARHAVPLIREFASRLVRRFSECLAAAQDRGQLRADLDLRFAAISIVAQVAWFFVAQPVVTLILGHQRRLPDREVDRYLEHVITFTLAAVAESPRAPRRARPRARP